MFQLDFASRVPIYEQIYVNVVKLASAGVLKSGDRLPAVRTLATQLGINPNTVAKTYKMLENDGYIISTVGRGTYLTEKLTQTYAQRLMTIENFRKAADEARKLGVPMEKLVQLVDVVYKGGEVND